VLKTHSAQHHKYRAKEVPARRGKGKKCPSGDGTDQTPAEKRVSMAGFCSCKTGIHAIPGNNPGSGPDHCQYRRPGSDQDPTGLAKQKMGNGWRQGFLRPDIGMVATSMGEETDSSLQQANSVTIRGKPGHRLI